MTAGSSGPFPEAPLFPRPAQGFLALFCLLIASLAAFRGYQLTAWANRPLDIQPGYRVNLNRANLAELELLPALGPTLARRVEEYRHNRGGFRDVNELLEIPGIGPILLEQIQARVVIDTQGELSSERPANVSPNVSKGLPEGTKLNPNLATLEELNLLPGVGPTLATRIVESRNALPFKSVDDLRRIRGIGVKTLEAIRPHLHIE